jgi:hypothetical protein
LPGPDADHKSTLRRRFDRVFQRRTGFATLDRLLKRLHANKGELLRVLERPKIPLHTNGSENDVRYVAFRGASAAVGPGSGSCGSARGVRAARSAPERAPTQDATAVTASSA